MTDIHTFTTVGSIWFLCAVMAGIVANERGRRFWVWFPLGVLTGPVGLYLVLRAHEVVPLEKGQVCPHCQKVIRKGLVKCPRCGELIPQERVARPERIGRQAAAAVFLVRRAVNKTRESARKAEEKRKAANGERQT